MTNKTKKFIKITYSIVVLTGALLVTSLIIKRGDILRKSHSRDCIELSLLNKISCAASETIDLVYKNLINFNNLMPGSRLESKESFKRFKNKSSGFDFSYPSDSNFLNGYLLLSKYDPDEFIPKIELWDLNSQKMIHTWKMLRCSIITYNVYLSSANSLTLLKLWFSSQKM